MNPRDHLDELIDRSAARLVSVDPDAEMVGRILESLPDRPSAASRWMLWWLPRCAAAVTIVAAVVMWNRNAPEVPASSVVAPNPSGQRVLKVEQPEVLPKPKPSVVARRERPQPEVLEPALVDHERSLAFVERPDLLELPSIAAPALEPEEALSVAPLVLTELPLSGESFSPR